MLFKKTFGPIAQLETEDQQKSDAKLINNFTTTTRTEYFSIAFHFMKGMEQPFVIRGRAFVSSRKKTKVWARHDLQYKRKTNSLFRLELSTQPMPLKYYLLARQVIKFFIYCQLLLYWNKKTPVVVVNTLLCLCFRFFYMFYFNKQ